jgi:hypothetical protein
MQEIRTAIHINTHYTRGRASHADLLAHALAADLDVIITTDQNLLVHDLDGYAHKEGKNCLLLTAEEIFDRTQIPPQNRLLVLDSRHEFAPDAARPQQVVKKAAESKGMTFLAHPFAAGKTGLGKLLPPWTAEDIPDGITGIEVWNSLSELQGRASNRPLAYLLSHFPRLLRRGPNPITCQYWDELLAAGKTVTAIAGSGLGSLKNANPRLQHYLLTNISNYLIIPKAFSGELADDRRMVFDALRQGHSFIACDDLATAKGFRFSAKGRDEKADIGDSVILKDSVTFQIRLPQAAKCLLFRDGELICKWEDTDTCVHNSTEPGAYRVEVILTWLGQDVTWIISNPIYVRPYIPPPLRDQLYDSY